MKKLGMIFAGVSIFGLGVAVGSVITGIMAKKTIEKLTIEKNEEVKEVREYYHDKLNYFREAIHGLNEEAEKRRKAVENTEPEGPNQGTKYYDIANKYSPEEGREITDVKDRNRPYIITPEEYEDCEYNILMLTCYSDGVITYDDDEIVEDIEDYIGDIKPLEHFGEYEEDCIYVRNDDKEIAIEIARDLNNYYDMYDHPTEG